MPRRARKCPVFIEVPEASTVLKWREMFRQSSVTPATRARARGPGPRPGPGWWRPLQSFARFGFETSKGADGGEVSDQQIRHVYEVPCGRIR
jgi:hypothetical protein